MSKDRCPITKELKKELVLLEAIIKNPKINWSTPISHMVVRDPDFAAWGDSSLSQAGGFSHDLKFWWHWEWPNSIQARTLSAYQLKAKIDDKLISINLLEYAVVITNYAITTQIKDSKNPAKKQYQSLLNWTDNMSALAWTKKAAISTPAGKALSKIFCSLCINNNIACTSNYINTKENRCADLISRVPTNNNVHDFSMLIQEFPELKSYQRLHLSSEFRSCLLQALLHAHSPNLDQIPQPIQKNQEGITLSTS